MFFEYATEIQCIRIAGLFCYHPHGKRAGDQQIPGSIQAIGAYIIPWTHAGILLKHIEQAILIDSVLVRQRTHRQSVPIMGMDIFRYCFEELLRSISRLIPRTEKRFFQHATKQRVNLKNGKSTGTA